MQISVLEVLSLNIHSMHPQLIGLKAEMRKAAAAGANLSLLTVLMVLKPLGWLLQGLTNDKSTDDSSTLRLNQCLLQTKIYSRIECLYAINTSTGLHTP